ncbi:MAG TPA: DUF6805 domain-containing protein, partial [Puia sp.]
GLSLMVRYWGAEERQNAFDIYIDDKLLAAEDLAGKWNKASFENVEYVIPDALVEGKESVRVSFRARPGHSTGRVFYIRMLKK